MNESDIIPVTIVITERLEDILSDYKGCPPNLAGCPKNANSCKDCLKKYLQGKVNPRDS